MREIIHGKDVFVDKYVKDNLEVYQKRLKKNWDSWIVISGDEGDGKSVLAKQMCAIVDPDFNIDKIAWTPDQFKEIVLKAEKFTAVLYDEAISGMNSRRAMSSINNALISMAAQCRKRNLFVVICLPSYFDLDKNIAIHRSRGLFHVFADKLERGYFKFYNKDRKQGLYVDGKKYYNMKCRKCNAFGRFLNWSVVDEVEYEKRKDKALIEQNTEEEGVHKYSIMIDRLLQRCKIHGDTNQLLSDWIGEQGQIKLDPSSISKRLSKYTSQLIIPKVHTERINTLDSLEITV